MIVYTYIIQTRFNTIYCGITNNLKRRLKEHKAKQLLYAESHNTRKQARRREVIIKNSGVKKTLNKLQWQLSNYLR